MKSKYKVYISGPITNNSDYIKDFDQAEIDIKEYLNHEKEIQLEIINPTKLPHNPDGNYDYIHCDYMRLDLKALLDCDGIWLIGDWRNSKGSLTEVHVAQSLCLDFYSNGDAISFRNMVFELKLLIMDERYVSLDKEMGF